MQRSSYHPWGGWNDGRIGDYSQDEYPSEFLDTSPLYSASPPALNISQDEFLDISLPTVDQFPVPAFGSAPGNSGFSGNPHPTFYGSTFPNPSMPHHESTSNSRDMTSPIPSRVAHFINPPHIDLFASTRSSEFPTYGIDPPLSLQDVLPMSADGFMSHDIAALTGPSDHVAAGLLSSYPVVNDGPQPSESAEVPTLLPTPSMSSVCAHQFRELLHRSMTSL